MLNCCNPVNDALGFDYCGDIRRAGYTRGSQLTSIGQYFGIMEASDLTPTIESLASLVDDKFNTLIGSACTDELPVCYAATEGICYTYGQCCPAAGTACNDGNPATMKIYLLFLKLGPYVEQQDQLNIVNQMGQLLKQTTIDKTDSSTISVDISNLADGLYFVQLVIDNEVKEIVKVIVK